jgi:molecular chaperone GrpE
MDQHNHDHKHEKPDHPHAHDHHAGESHADAAKTHNPSADSASASGKHSNAPQHEESAAVNSAAAPHKAVEQQRKDREKIEELESKLASANDKYLRLMAEFDNFKRRTAKEYQQLIEQANEKLIKDLLDVREGFERAFKADTEGTDLQSFVDGMKMIFAKLDNVLHKHGLEVYCEAGQEFDPQLHDAMMNSASDKIPEHHVAEVLEKGYKLKGKVIKHSRVIVSSGKPVSASESRSATSGDDEAKAAFEAGAGLDADTDAEPTCP